MPKIFTTLDKIKPAYDVTYKVVLFICKILLIVDILITTMSVVGRYVPFIPDPAWSEEVVLTCMSYMAVLSAALAIRRGAHIRMTAFDVYLPKIAVKVLDILADLAVCILDLIILVLGMIMDMAPIILIATPILLPIATSIGIDPIQFGIIMVLNCGIGLLTPPVGAVLFIGSAVAKRPMEKVVKATLPFYLCMFVALLLLTFVPDISLAIPKLLGGYVSPITNPLGPVFIH